jgi:hypothetical protein
MLGWNDRGRMVLLGTSFRQFRTASLQPWDFIKLRSITPVQADPVYPRPFLSPTCSIFSYMASVVDL